MLCMSGQLCKVESVKSQCEPMWTTDVKSLKEDQKARAVAASSGLQGNSAGCKQHGRFLTPVCWRCRAALHWPIDLFDVRRFDSQLGQSLEMLAASHRAWQGSAGSAPEVLVDGQPIKDLCLTFVLPGDAALVSPSQLSRPTVLSVAILQLSQIRRMHHCVGGVLGGFKKPFACSLLTGLATL